jgi:hypothetical protein
MYAFHSDPIVAKSAICLMSRAIVDGHRPNRPQSEYVQQLFNRDVGVSTAAAMWLGLRMSVRECQAWLSQDELRDAYEHVAVADACLRAKRWHPARNEFSFDESPEMPEYGELDSRSLSFLDILKVHLVDADALVVRRVLAAYRGLHHYAEHCEDQICAAIQMADDDTADDLLTLLINCNRTNPMVRSLIADMFRHNLPLVRLNVLYTMLLSYQDWPTDFPRVLVSALCDNDDGVAHAAFKALSDSPKAAKAYRQALLPLLEPDRIGSVNRSIVEFLPEVINPSRNR